MLDVLDSIQEWRSFVSGMAHLDVSARASSLSLRYTLGDTGGFVVAQGSVHYDVRPRFALHAGFRYTGDPVLLEIKLVSADGKDVWRATRELGASEGQRVSIPGHDFEYAWGERGAGRPSLIGQIEFALVARQRCHGVLVIDSPMVRISGLPSPIHVAVMSGHERPELSQSVSLPPISGQAWYPGVVGDALIVDHGFDALFSGFYVHFAAPPVALAFSTDAWHEQEQWQALVSLQDVTASSLRIPCSPFSARRLRLTWLGGGAPPHVVAFEGIMIDEARTPNELASGTARSRRRGEYPASLLGEQVWWTCLSNPDAGQQALLNEHGAVEFGFASPILEPSWLDHSGWHSWADAHSQCFLEDALPLPVVKMQWPERTLEVKPQWVTPMGGVQIRYQWTNHGTNAVQFEFLVTLTPFQISPPSQQYGVVGGCAPIHRIEKDGDALVVNGQYRLSTSSPPVRCSISSGVQADPRFSTAAGPDAVRDDVTKACMACLVWSVNVAPGSRWSVDICVNAVEHSRTSAAAWPAFLSYRDNVIAGWRHALAQIDVQLPSPWQDAIDAWRMSVAHILSNRQGVMINPGPRRYARSWIRDAATMGEALLKAGLFPEVMAFVDAYAPAIRSDGYVPCCVDRDGSADPLVEHDSHGQWIVLVAAVFRYTGDREFLLRHASSVFAAAEHIQALRQRRSTREWNARSRYTARGLIPESVSHEGYLAQAVHSYWDDIWCLRGLSDAVEIASSVGDLERMARYRDEVSDFRQAIHDSLQAVQSERQIDYVPGSVEWADLDPSATACGPAQLGMRDIYPGDSIQRTMTLFMEHWRERVSAGRAQTKYSAYDVRVVRALVNLDRRTEAHELLAFLLNDRRPLAWHQWPEISWPDPASAGHVGDLPHSWISAEYALAIRNCLVEEEGEDLILMRGVPLAWLLQGRVDVRSLPTRFGTIGFEAWSENDAWGFRWRRLPPGIQSISIRCPRGDVCPAKHNDVQFFPLSLFGDTV